MHGQDVGRMCVDDDADYYVRRRAEILRECGQLCDLTPSPDPVVRRPVTCAALWNGTVDAEPPLRWPPPLAPPCSMLDDFLTDGRAAPLHRWWFAERDDTIGYTPVWTAAQVDDMVDAARARQLLGGYGLTYTNTVLDEIARMDGVLGARVLVIGSASPWLEACFLAHGAASVTTLEYRELRSEHARVTALTPDAMRDLVLRPGALEPFDALGSVSSVEHSGLGRYGDALNPWGDLMAVARAWCIAKPGAQFLLGVPYEDGADRLVYNAHRIYGADRYTHLITNWRVARTANASGQERPDWQLPRVLVREDDVKPPPEQPRSLTFEVNGEKIVAGFGAPGEDLGARAREVVRAYALDQGFAGGGCARGDADCVAAIIERAFRQHIDADTRGGSSSPAAALHSQDATSSTVSSIEVTAQEIQAEAWGMAKTAGSGLLDPNDERPFAKRLLSFMSTDVLNRSACVALASSFHDYNEARDRFQQLTVVDDDAYNAYRCAYSVGDMVNAPFLVRGLDITYSPFLRASSAPDYALERSFSLHVGDPVRRGAVLRAFPGSIVSDYLARAERKYSQFVCADHPDLGLLSQAVDEFARNDLIAPATDELIVHVRAGDKGDVTDRYLEAVVRAVEISGARTVTVLAAAHWWTAEEMTSVSMNVGRICNLVIGATRGTASEIESCNHRRGSGADEDMSYMRRASYLLVHKGGFSALAGLISKGVVFYIDILHHFHRQDVRDLAAGRLVHLQIVGDASLARALRALASDPELDSVAADIDNGSESTTRVRTERAAVDLLNDTTRGFKSWQRGGGWLPSAPAEERAAQPSPRSARTLSERLSWLNASLVPLILRVLLNGATVELEFKRGSIDDLVNQATRIVVKHSLHGTGQKIVRGTRMFRPSSNFALSFSFRAQVSESKSAAATTSGTPASSYRRTTTNVPLAFN